MKNLILLIFILVLFSWEAVTSSTAFLDKSFSANFVKEIKSVIPGRDTIKEKGTLDYKYPSKLKLVYLDGEIEKTFVVNKSKAWDFTPAFAEGEKNELRIIKVKSFAILKVLDVLQSGLKTNKIYKVKKTKSKVILTFNKPKEYGVQYVELIPKEGEIKTFNDVKTLVAHHDGKKVDTFHFVSLEKKSFEDTYFIFKTPKNTNTTIQ